MSDYEARAWASLNSHWIKRANRRQLPQMPDWLTDAGNTVVATATKAGRKILEVTPTPVKGAAGWAADTAIMPTVKGVTHLLELISEWSQELMDPKGVVKLARKHGHQIDSINDLRTLDLKACDALLTRTALKWRTVGAVEGASLGLLTLIPAPGVGAAIAISADLVVIHIMSTAIATRVAHSYGIDARDPEEQEFIQQIITRSFIAQGAKAKATKETAEAARAIRGRVRWSRKLRDDQKLVAALERLMKQWYPRAHVPVQHVAKALPFVSSVVGAGTNSHLLGQVTSDAQKYCQTRFLAEKYALDLPKPLREDFEPALS
ncbi:EcsC family protein [Georgenia sp. SYP-B2076]|uniref:EcsC family protein n=1 Tax=Georgenia sp. SYP-B2076 TaxID=2495881 RepID=UPI00197AC9C4|nr:EcsC family protein [Georgenia sp. SYP-B2076]